jgi:hypothetical protein
VRFLANALAAVGRHLEVRIEDFAAIASDGTNGVRRQDILHEKQ